MKKILTIAGSDSSGGAGIQADLKTIMAHQMYGMSVITALTAQNTTGVYDILEATPEFIAKQLDCVFEDIFPDAVKIGMVSNPEIIKVITEKLEKYQPKFMVIDPVMISTSGSRLLSDHAREALITKLLPLGSIITPNIPEAQNLCGFEIDTKAKMVEAGKVIGKMITGAVLIKGGHSKGDADDLLYMNGQEIWFKEEKINNPNNHGTGCTLSSAIACRLAKGASMDESVRLAKEYVTGALENGLDIGRGRGPLNHCYLKG